MEFPSSFETRFFGKLANFVAELADELDRFEEVPEVINRDLTQQLLLMDVMLTSKAKSLSLWGKQVRDQEMFFEALHSLKKMNANFDVPYRHACTFQRDNCPEHYHELPMSLLEYQQMFPKRTHFVRDDTVILPSSSSSPSPASTKVGPPERDKTDGPRGTE